MESCGSDPAGQTSSFAQSPQPSHFFLVDDDTSVDQAHRMLLTDFDAGTDADAAALTFASLKPLNRFPLQDAHPATFLSGSSSVTSHERNCVLRC